MKTVLASAADERYGYHLLSMIGSVQRNSDLFDAIVVHDLGLNSEQRELAEAIRGVEVREVPAFVPHWAQGFTWKPWIWTHLDADRVFYLDAGCMVLRSLAGALAQIDERGYFVVSQAFPVSAIAPRSYLDDLQIDAAVAERESIAAGIIGFATAGRFWDDVVLPTYADCVRGLSVGFSANDAERLNFGLGSLDEVVIRDAKLFRHDQTVLNVHFLKAYPGGEATINDLYRYGGWRNPHEHPEQVVWNHRRAGDYRYLGRARYRPGAAMRAKRLAFRLRWPLWQATRGRALAPSALLGAVRARLVARLR